MLAHAHGDLTATVEAGATLRDLNARSRGTGSGCRSIRRSRTRRPSAASSRPTTAARCATGTARRAICDRHPAGDDRRRLAKAGGKVVKNVAGYDLAKLVAGSFGSLAAIVSATFKLVADSGSVEDAGGRGRGRRRARAGGPGGDGEPARADCVRGRTCVAAEHDGTPVERDEPRSIAVCAQRPAALRVAADCRGAQVAAASKRCRAARRRSTSSTAPPNATLWRAHCDAALGRAGRDRARQLAAGVDCRRPGRASARARSMIWPARGVGAGLCGSTATSRSRRARSLELRHSPHVGNVVVLRGSAVLRRRSMSGGRRAIAGVC